MHVTHPLAEEVVDLLRVFDHAPSSAHLLVSALRPGLHHPLHIAQDHVLMDDTQQRLRGGGRSVGRADGRTDGSADRRPHLSAGWFQVSQVAQLSHQGVQQRIHDRKRAVQPHGCPQGTETRLNTRPLITARVANANTS